MKSVRILSLLFLFLLPQLVHAATGSSLNIPIGDPTYEYIDKLSASGLIKTPIYGSKPWTRLYAAKLLSEALSNKEKIYAPLEKTEGTISYEKYSRRIAHKRFIDAILKEMILEYYNELQEVDSEIAEKIDPELLDHIRIHGKTYAEPLRSIAASYTYLNTAPSPIPDNGLGKINGVVDPLVANRQGNQYVKGQNFFAETESYAQLSPYFTAYVKPQFQFLFPSNNVSDGEISHAYIKNLYAKTGWRNIELEVGRDQMLWGQGLHGGLMFSDNPRGLDQLKLSTPYPFRLPWVFEKLGHFKWSGFAANLGPQQTPSKPWIMGYRLDWKPCEYFDFGFGHILELGGSGTTLPAPWKIGLEFIGIPAAGGGGVIDSKSDTATNRIFSIDMRFVIKELRDLSFYVEGLVEDTDLNLVSMAENDMGWLGGLYLPRLDYTGKWALRGEFEKITKNPYRHGLYVNGWTLNSLLIGNITGPVSNRATITVDYNFSPLSKITGNFTFISRSSNKYAPKTNPDGSNDGFIVTYVGPHEYHALNTYTLTIPLTKTIHQKNGGLQMTTTFGWDYVVNKDFAQGNKKTDLLGEIGLKLFLPQF